MISPRRTVATTGCHGPTLAATALDFWLDDAGTGLREYAAAVILAALAVVVGLTLVAAPLYRVYVRLYGP